MNRGRGFESMYSRFMPRITAYCLRRTNQADARDAVAEVFAIAWRRRDDMPAGANALPWLYGVARNVLKHQRRGGYRRTRLRARVGGRTRTAATTPEDVVLEREEHARIRDALALLGDGDREVLMLSAWEGLTHAEIAETLGQTLAAIDKRLARAKRKLARHYDALEHRAAKRPTSSHGGVA